MTPKELRTALKSVNLPQTQLALKLGVSDRTVRRWVSGESGISRFIAPEIKKIIENHGNNC